MMATPVVDEAERRVMKELSSGPKFFDELLEVLKVSKNTLLRKLKSLVERNLIGWREIRPSEGIKGRKRMYFARNQGGFFKMNQISEELVFLEPVDWEMESLRPAYIR